MVSDISGMNAAGGQMDSANLDTEAASFDANSAELGVELAGSNVEAS